MFKKHYDETKILVKTKKKTFKEVFKRHYGAFIEEIISNHYRPESSIFASFE